MSAPPGAGSEAMRDGGDLTRRMMALTRKLASADMRAVEIATTPKDPVWQAGKVTLYRYRPRAEGAGLGPLLIVQGLFGRHTMTDLQPGRSLVEALVAGGVDLYVIDWGNPTRADRLRDFSDYALDYLGQAVARICALSGVEATALMGVCQGGVFALCHAALRPARIKGVIAAVTPIDFHADRDDPDPTRGFLFVWSRNLPPALVDDMIADYGNLPGALTGAVFQGLAPARTFSKYTSDLLDIAEDDDALETFLRMEKWLADRPDHPGAAARQWLVELFHANKLAEGRFEIAGERVALERIACPVLNLYGAQDHIIPPASSRALAAHIPASRYREIEVQSGHIGVFVSRKAQETVAPAVLDWLAGL